MKGIISPRIRLLNMLLLYKVLLKIDLECEAIKVTALPHLFGAEII